MNSPLKVGITGGIGTGKTTVTNLFKLFGIPIYDADTRAKALMESNGKLVQSIIDLFGNEAYLNNKLNRQFLAKTVFSDEEELAKLNSLVHPVVAEDFELWASSFSGGYVLKEAALLFETGSYKDLDYVILVTSPLALREERIKIRDPQRPISQIQGIISKQMSSNEATKLADFIIHNDEQKMLIPQVIKLNNLLT